MGLLDDAIREHLELKRRRGADPAEVERAEREALGPVRRGLEEPLGAAPAEVADRESEAEEFAYDAPDGWDDVDPGHAAPHHALEDHGYDEDFADDAPADPTPAGRSHDEPAPRRGAGRGGAPPVQFAGESFDDDEPLPPGDPAEPPFDDEPDARNSRASDPAEGHGAESAEDVLEETPEFLQDTPDHDRLWFEQRPPRDFDFDG